MTDAHFQPAINENPFDPDVRLVYADWLEERGDPRAELIRLQDALRRIDVPERPAAERRLQELLAAGVPPTLATQHTAAGVLVAILPGQFRMGSPAGDPEADDDEKQVEVTLNGYWLGQTVVTQGLWQSVMGTEPWSGEYGGVKAGANYPATYVSWEDAVEFCRTLSEREQQAGRLQIGWKYFLPTEAQWEYACRAGTTTRYSFGDDAAVLGNYVLDNYVLGNYAWFDENAYDKDEKYAHVVGTKQANPWGLFDMHGNVWEWCSDGYEKELRGGTDPSVSKGSFRVRRGGSWYSSAWSCRSANRDWSARDWSEPSYSYRSDLLGFRLALSPSGQ